MPKTAKKCITHVAQTGKAESATAERERESDRERERGKRGRGTGSVSFVGTQMPQARAQETIF